MAAIPGGQQAWQNLTLQNGWVNYDATTWDSAQFMKDSLGFVHLRGFIKSGTATSGTRIATLPVGYRPAKNTYLPGTTNTGLCTFQISSNGDILAVTAFSASYSSFGDAVFKAEG